MDARYLTSILALLLIWPGPADSFGQTIGIPFVESYPKEVYGYGTQNWDIEQGAAGLLYFANNEGLMEFDGSDWRLFPLPNKTILRSILIKEAEGIYAGGQNEFGIYRPDRLQKWRFESLKGVIPEAHRNFEDVWNMEHLNDELYFRASEKIFITDGRNCTVLDQLAVNFLGKARQTLFVQDMNGLLYLLDNRSFSVLPGSEALRGTEVRKIIAVEDHFLIATFRNGLYLYDRKTIEKWENQGERQFDDPFISAIDVLANGDIVIGAGFKGLVIMDALGRFKYVVKAEEGLANNRIICTFVDRHKNLWLGHDNGISMVQTNSPFSRIYPRGELEGAGYDVAIHENKIYLATSSGLLYTDWAPERISGDLRLIENSNGQVWGIDVVNDELILNHDEGAFFVRGARAYRFFDETGAWMFEQDDLHENLILAGTYKGISIFERDAFRRLYDIPDLNESSRFIVQDAFHHYWMAHPYRGIYRISYPHDPARRKVELLGPELGLPSNLHNHIFKINGEVLVCAEKGVFVFDGDQQVFSPYEPINQYLDPGIKVRRLFEAPNGDVWFITEKEVGVLKVEEKGLTRTISKKVFPELKALMNGGWEKIYPYDDRHVFITTIHGFIHYDGSRAQLDSPAFNIVLNEMSINKDSTIFPLATPDKFVFPHWRRSFLFNVAATEYVNNDILEFQYFLEGFDEDWTPPSTLRAKEYTNLPPGDYTLKIRARNINGQLSSVYTLNFEIAKPWYATTPVLLVYLVLLITAVYLLYRRSQQKFKALEQRADSLAKRSKEEIQRLETEKIQAELDHKKRELVSATLHLVQKNETISDLVGQLSQIKRKSREEEVKRQLQKLIRSLKNDEVFDEGWDQVMYHFRELHEDFFERLKKSYPSLTPKDLKMCAYLKMNLTTKEMASLMNVSIRGVEASRYRLRKKLDLPTEANLTEFIMTY